MRVGIDICLVATHNIRAGLYNYTANLATALAAAGVRQTLYCPRTHAPWASRAFPGRRVRGVQSPPRFYKLWRRYTAFNRSDVYLHNLGSEWGPITGGGNVYCVPDMIPLAVDYGAYTPVFRESCRRYCEEAVRSGAAVVVWAEHAKRDLLARVGGDAARIHVAPLAPGPEYAPASQAVVAAARARHGLGDAPYVLSVSTLEVRKNYPALVRAFARLVTRNPALPHRLVLVGGKGPGHETVFAEIAACGVGDRVVHLGFADDLPALYSGAAAFVFPSRYEGFGLPPLEAMACGTPVICSNATCLPEVVGDAALSFDPDDIDALTGHLDRVLADQTTRADLSARGLARAAQFTWAKTAAKYAAVLRAAAESRTGL